MNLVTIDLDRLRDSMPAHPTWPTAYDTTDDEEREECWQALTRWLETALCAPESDATGVSGTVTPDEPQTATTKGGQ